MLLFWLSFNAHVIIIRFELLIDIGITEATFMALQRVKTLSKNKIKLNMMFKIGQTL